MSPNPAMYDGSYQKQPKTERKRPWWSSVPYSSDKQKERNERWAFIKRDHITPRGKGGADEPENAQLLCRKHHERKHRNQPEWSGK